MKNAQLRKRLYLIEASIGYEALIYPEQLRQRNSRYSLMRTWAFIPENYLYLGLKPFNQEVNETKGYSNEALKLSELTKYSTWFAKHPEKVSGDYKVTSSLHFPLTIVASKEDVISCIKKGIANGKNKPNNLLELEAEANLNLLNLLELELTL